MGETKKEMLLKILGERLRLLRVEADLDAEDVAEMTGLSAPTIRRIERGSETNLSNFLGVCLALKMHPKEVLDIEMEIKPFFELSNTRKEKTRLTPRIEHFIKTDFFEQERTSRDVVNELAAQYNIKTNTSSVSVILKRKVEEEELKAYLKDSIKIYKKG